MVAQEYLQKQDDDLIVNNKTKQWNGLLKKRNDICSDSKVVILPTPFKEGVEVQLWYAGKYHYIFTADCFKDTKLLFVDTMPKVVDSFAQITKITPSIRMVVWLLYQYKPNLSSLLYT